MTLPIETPAVVEDRPELASKIQEQFDKVFADVNESDLLDETPAPEAAPEAEEKPAPEAEAEETTEEAPAEEAVVDEPADKPAATKEAAPTPGKTGPTLPDAYRRSLKAYEWTDEEINANLAAMGPAFIQTAAKIHQNRNKELAGWAEAGRKQRTDSAVTVNTPAGANSPQAQRPQQAAPDATTRLQPVDAAALKKQYGEEALIDAIVGPVNATIEQINRILPVVQQTQHRAAEAQLETFARQIDGFFAGKDMTAYQEQYGRSSASLTNEQLGSRQKVLEFADALVAGARQQGRLLSLDEAMQMAHDSTAAGGQQRAARQQIKTEMKARNKGITLKPSARGSGTAVAATRSNLEKSVKKGLAAAFNS